MSAKLIAPDGTVRELSDEMYRRIENTLKIWETETGSIEEALLAAHNKPSEDEILEEVRLHRQENVS